MLEDYTVVLLLEPLDCILLAHSVMNTNRTLGNLLLGNTATWSGDLDVEIHTVDTSAWVVLDTEIDVLLDTETEVSTLSKVSVLKFVLLNLQTLLKDLLGLLTSDGNMAGDLVVSANTEGSDSISSLREDWLLVSQLLQHLGGTGESITWLTDTDVENELLDAWLAHGVIFLGLLDLIKRYKKRKRCVDYHLN